MVIDASPGVCVRPTHTAAVCRVVLRRDRCAGLRPQLLYHQTQSLHNHATGFWWVVSSISTSQFVETSIATGHGANLVGDIAACMSPNTLLRYLLLRERPSSPHGYRCCLSVEFAEIWQQLLKVRGLVGSCASCDVAHGTCCHRPRLINRRKLPVWLCGCGLNGHNVVHTVP